MAVSNQRPASCQWLAANRQRWLRQKLNVAKQRKSVRRLPANPEIKKTTSNGKLLTQTPEVRGQRSCIMAGHWKQLEWFWFWSVSESSLRQNSIKSRDTESNKSRGQRSLCHVLVLMMMKRSSSTENGCLKRHHHCRHLQDNEQCRGEPGQHTGAWS